ncbi:MAG: DNA-binding PadR family transcriptional regulator [Desulforhopalus sp.]|jgi:DNA-binding PadR family transcriptional regulator
MTRRKSKARSGTWIERQVYASKAFWSLSGTAKGMLILFLSKRDMSKNHEVLNLRSIYLTYKELENLFGTDEFGKPQGLSRASIARGIKDLMAKGFIEIVRQGGTYQSDKTVYGLTDDWKRWSKGLTIREKQKGKAASRNTANENLNPTTEPIHTLTTVP